MCGIVGMINYTSAGFDHSSRSAFFPMLLLNSMRGMHSTGVFGIEQSFKGKDKVEWIKRVGNPYWLAMETNGKEFFERIYSRYCAVIGHGRYATQGKVNAKNAHPFKHGHITLVHNGSVRNFYKLKHKGDYLQPKFDVDSDALAYLISEVGIHKAMSEVEGAFALMWHDAKEQCIFALRNSERPLHVALRDRPGGLYFSSEAPTLEYVTSRFSDITFEGDKAKYLEPDYLYRFPLGTGKENVIEKEKIKIGRPVYSSGFGNRGRRQYTGFEGYGDMAELFERENDRPITEIERMRIASEEAEEKKGTNVIPFQKKEGTTMALFKKEEKKADRGAKIKSLKEPKSGATFKVGAMVAFYPSNLEKIGDKSLFIHGDCVDSDAVSVACHYNGELGAEDLKDEVVLAGRISNIIYLGTDKSTHLIRVYVKELTQLHPKVQNKLMTVEVENLDEEVKKHPFDPNDPSGDKIFIKTKNETLSFSKFEMWQARGCLKCKGQISIEDAPKCLTVLPDDKDYVYGGIICPDCAIHRVLH